MLLVLTKEMLAISSTLINLLCPHLVPGWSAFVMALLFGEAGPEPLPNALGMGVEMDPDKLPWVPARLSDRAALIAKRGEGYFSLLWPLSSVANSTAKGPP